MSNSGYEKNDIIKSSVLYLYVNQFSTKNSAHAN